MDKPILVVQLLRLGDILLSLPALNDLKSKYPERELHLLLDESFLKVCPFLPMVDRVFSFKRSKYQNHLGESRFSFFSAFDFFNKDMNELKKINYSKIYNFSHNKISADIIEPLVAIEKMGMVADSENYNVIGQAFKKLNNSSSGFDTKTLHYTDYLRLSAEQPNPTRIQDINFEVPPDSKIGEIVKSDYIVIQAFSNEPKKSLNSRHIQNALKTFFSLNRSSSAVLLGAPFEQSQLDEIENEIGDFSGRLLFVSATLEEAFSIIKNAQALISVDTSIKHLASLTNTTIVEVALGSANPIFTGAYRSNTFTVVPKVDCFPCSHSEGCTKTSRVCIEGIDSEFLGLMLFKLIDQKNEIQVLAEEYSDQLTVYKTFVTKFGHYIVPMEAQVSNDSIEQTMVKWMSRLDSFMAKEIDSKAGSMAIEFYNLLVGIYGRKKLGEIKSQINEIMTKYVMLLNDLQANTTGTDYSKLYYNQSQTKRQVALIMAFVAELDWHEDSELKSLDVAGNSFQTVRVLQSTTDLLKRRLEFGLRILRNLQTSILEATYEIGK